MESQFTKISDINNVISDDFLIKVRVIRLWKMPGYTNKSQTNSIEVILMDKEVYSKQYHILRI